MPINWDDIRKQQEQEQLGLFSKPVDTSGTQGRIAGERAQFASRFGLNPVAAASKTAGMDRSLNENMDKITYDRQTQMIKQKWESVYNMALQATGDVQASIKYANAYMDQTTSLDTQGKAQETQRQANDRAQTVKEQYAQKGLDMSNAYEDEAGKYNYANAIASILGSSVGIGTTEYMRNKPITTVKKSDVSTPKSYIQSDYSGNSSNLS